MNDTTTRPATIQDLEDCAPYSAYGVKLWEDEDDWGWTVLGTPDHRRVLAAINRYTRKEIGAGVDLFEATDGGDLEVFDIKSYWITNPWLDANEEFLCWDRCEEGAPGSIPMLRVTLR